jgi:hypothetical protein
MSKTKKFTRRTRKLTKLLTRLEKSMRERIAIEQYTAPQTEADRSRHNRLLTVKYYDFLMDLAYESRKARREIKKHIRVCNKLSKLDKSRKNKE